jgi:hypothetical protein
MVYAKDKGSNCGVYLNRKQKVVWFPKFKENLKEVVASTQMQYFGLSQKCTTFQVIDKLRYDN